MKKLEDVFNDCLAEVVFDHVRKCLSEVMHTDATRIVREWQEKFDGKELVDRFCQALACEKEDLFELSRKTARGDNLITDFQKYIVDRYLGQDMSDEERGSLCYDLTDKTAVPKAVIDAVREKNDRFHLEDYGTIVDVPASFSEKQAIVARPKTLTEVFECELGKWIFGDLTARLSVEDIRAKVVEATNDGVYPGVSFLCEYEIENVRRSYMETAIGLAEKEIDECMGFDSDTLQEFVGQANKILQAYGYNKEQFYAALGFEPEKCIEVPVSIKMALEERKQTGKEPVWNDDEARKLWFETLREIDARVGLNNYEPGFWIPTGFCNGEQMCMISLTGIDSDFRDYGCCVDIEPDHSMTRFQEHAIAAFFEQDLANANITELIEKDSQNLPAAVKKGAYAHWELQLQAQKKGRGRG